MLHIALHIIVPLTIAVVFWRSTWRDTWLWLLLGWSIDIDHLLASPIYDPDRCSIGFHPLHSAPAMLVYALVYIATFGRWRGGWTPRVRLVLLGVAVHLILDASDCFY